MGKCFILGVVCFLFINISVVSADTEETVKIYSTDDGFAQLYDEANQTVWLNARGYTGPLIRDTLTTDNRIVVRSDKQSGKFRIYRASILFDTDDIPDDAVIQSASLNVYKEAEGNNDGNTRYVFTSHQRAIATQFTKADWYLSNYGQEFSRGLLLDAQYTIYPLNVAGLNYIQKDGRTIFGGMTEFDFDDVPQGFAPKTGSFYSSEASGTSTDPYLEITYTVPDPVSTPEELVASLINVVNESGSRRSVQNSYIANIKKIVDFFNGSQTEAALNQISALLKKVAKDELLGDISSATADEIEALSQQLVVLLEELALHI